MPAIARLISWPRSIAHVLAVIGLLSLSTHAQERRVLVSGMVRGASGQHTIHICLWDARGFLKNAVEESFLSPHTSIRYALMVPVGRWAIAVSEDRNEDGELDLRQERLAFWPTFNGQRRPRFDDVAVQIDHDVVDADITLR